MTTLDPKPRKLPWKQWLTGYAFALPFIIGLLLFVAYPIGYALWLAFQRWDLIGEARFVGWDNFAKVFSDETALKALANTAIYTAVAVPLQLLLSFTLALMLTQPVRMRDFLRAGFYLPIIVPLVASAVVWQRVFNPDYGILNQALGWFGIEGKKWIFDANWTLPAFIFMSLWQVGRQMVIFIAGLGNVPQSLIEAASLDGAGPLTKLLRITVPLMTPLIFYNMVIAIINSFQIFGPALIMCGEGGSCPENSGLFSVLNIYRQGFQFFNMGYASALAWELFVIVIGFTITQFYISQRWVYYEE